MNDEELVMDKRDLPGAIEALLFVSDEPVSALTLSEMTGCELADIEATLDELRQSYESANRGIQLREVAGGWRFYTSPKYHDLVERYVLSWDTRKLSQAALETLAVVAYNQPITRAGVATVRGVNSDSPINSLVEKGLLREAGRDKAAPGQPVLYATSKSFLEKFGLASVADLPDLEEFAPDEESKNLIRERLGVTRADAAASEQRLFDEDLTLDLGLDDSERIVGAFAPAVDEASEVNLHDSLSEALAQGFAMPESVWEVPDSSDEAASDIADASSEPEED